MELFLGPVSWWGQEIKASSSSTGPGSLETAPISRMSSKLSRTSEVTKTGSYVATLEVVSVLMIKSWIVSSLHIMVCDLVV